MKKIALVAVLFLFSQGAFAEGVNHEGTTTPPDARVQIVQSPLNPKYTFRLDTYTGQVEQLVTGGGIGK
jgi:uncharacterized protein YdeI (BOF family)